VATGFKTPRYQETLQQGEARGSARGGPKRAGDYAREKLVTRNIKEIPKLFRAKNVIGKRERWGRRNPPNETRDGPPEEFCSSRVRGTERAENATNPSAVAPEKNVGSVNQKRKTEGKEGRLDTSCSPGEKGSKSTTVAGGCQRSAEKKVAQEKTEEPKLGVLTNDTRTRENTKPGSRKKKRR